MYRPEIGETYYVVKISSYVGIEDYEWLDDTIDNEHYSIGNVFRTEHEAEDKLNEIKQILKQNEKSKIYRSKTK